MEKLEKFKKLAEKIKKAAESSGADTNYLFLTTFNRYEVQLEVLDKLETEIKNGDTIVSKEYVKGRENIYVHPAIKMYNSTADSANKTVSALLKILKEVDLGGEVCDPLLEMINGDDCE